MDCATCGERLADFLLDELPESEAVLVQEHLSLCATCMRTYKELKGTGKALEAVPSMRPVEGSPEFERDVRAQAAAELQQILARLPADKRLKLEARRAARMSRVAEKPPPPRPLFPARLLLAVAAGCGLLALILAYPDSSASNAPRAPLGSLSLTVGKVEQFYQRANEPHTPVKEGKPFLAGAGARRGRHPASRQGPRGQHRHG
ncbi:MAG: zf-HC2 domain-containing protein [Planctomycetota bacterium]|nr:zf-HC2 domain-containing protein [Planctomycetota bacterium]